MPVVVRSVLLVGSPRPPAAADARGARCDGCGGHLAPGSPVVLVRNRTGPGAVRTARLCQTCLEAIDVAIDLTDDVR